jgi:hypothetical protein
VIAPAMRRACARTSVGQSGFTLMEVVIAFAIAAGAIVLGVALYRTVGTATQSARTAERDWVTEQFLRDQFGAAELNVMQGFSLVRQRSRELGFVTLRSAQWGANGPPVLAVWRYDAADASLRYRETQLPAWWPEDRPPNTVDYDGLSSQTGATVWQGRIFSDVEDMKFGYWDGRTKNWIGEEPERAPMASIVRLMVRRAAEDERTFVFARGGSSSSSPSGSSPAAH